MTERTFEEMVLERLRDVYLDIDWRMHRRHHPVAAIPLGGDDVLELKVHRYGGVVTKPWPRDEVLPDVRTRMILDARIRAADRLAENETEFLELLSKPEELWSSFEDPLSELSVRWWISPGDAWPDEKWTGEDPVAGVALFLENLVGRCAKKREAVERTWEAACRALGR